MIQYKHIVGLDVGSHAVKAVKASRRPGSVVAWRDLQWVRLPSSQAEQRKMLRSFVEKNGLRRAPCVLAVRGRSAMVQTLTIDPKDPRAVAEIVNVELGRVEGLAGAETVSAYDSFRGPGGERLVLVAVARVEAVREAMSAAAELELDAVDVVPAAVAMCEAVTQAIGRGAGCTACVEAGHGGTEVAVVAKGRLVFARYLSRGAAAFAAAPEAATDGDGVAAWAGELAACLEAYAGQFKGPEYRLERVVLLGGGALQPGLAPRVTAATGVKAFLLREVMRRRVGEGVERFGLAMGLAAAGVRRGSAGLSLFPRAKREQLALRWQKKYWLLAAAALVASMLTLIGGTYRALRQAQEALRGRQAEWAALRGQEQELGRERQAYQDAEATMKPFRSGVHNGEIVRAVLDAVAAAKHPDDWIVMLADERSYFGPATAPKVDPRVEKTTETSHEEPVAFEHLIVEGYTPVDDFSTVRRMIEALRGSPAVESADLLADERVRKDEARDALWRAPPCRLFAIELKVRMP